MFLRLRLRLRPRARLRVNQIQYRTLLPHQHHIRPILNTPNRPIPPTRCLLQEGTMLPTMLPRLLCSIRRSTTNNIHHKRKVVEVGAWLAA
ncbi:hypothetical protein VTJ04DRAFT_3082 [Mycothermus thermophilus]|uniref:uncharacterized protein n=1 Tax=Humicola insolens TaxID=85995 RepID=UPI0037429E19